MKHTPGPWRHVAIEGGWDGVKGEQGDLICKLAYNNPANARLIAAAPDLLRAAIEMRAFIATTMAKIGFLADPRLLGLANDAIAKAQGAPND